MAIFTRAIRGWNLSRNLDIDLTLGALQRTGLEPMYPRDPSQRPGRVVCSLRGRGSFPAIPIQISMATQGKLEENGYAVRLIRTIKEDEVDLSEYRDFAVVYRHIEGFLEDVYNTKRIHPALGYLIPAEFEATWRMAQPVLATP